MRAIIAVAFLASVVLSQTTSIPEPYSPPPASTSSITALVCINKDPKRRCSTNCTTYTIKPKQCFDTVPGENLELDCIPFPSCVEGTEYFGNNCTGNDTHSYTTACNTCQGGRLVKCSGNNVTHYDCPLREDFGCTNLTECREIFTAQLGSCTTMHMGFFNVSVQLPATRSRCNMIRVEQFFNSQCDRRGSFAPGPHFTFPPHHSFAPFPHHWTRAPGGPGAQLEEPHGEHHGHHARVGDAAVEHRGHKQHPHRHHEKKAEHADDLVAAQLPHEKHMDEQQAPHPPHRWSKHEVYYYPAGKCEETQEDVSIEFNCKSTHATEDLPRATPEILALIQRHIHRHAADKKQILSGRHRSHQ